MGTTPLNLATADISGFDPFRAALYEVMVTKIDDVSVKNESGEGKYPAGTEGYNFEFTVQGGEFEGRKVWNNYWLLGADYIASLSPDEQKKANFTVGRFARALIALGYAEKDVTSGKFKFDKDDVINRRATASVGIQGEQGGYPARNIIRDLKPLQNLAESGIL